MPKPPPFTAFRFKRTEKPAELDWQGCRHMEGGFEMEAIWMDQPFAIDEKAYRGEQFLGWISGRLTTIEETEFHAHYVWSTRR